MLWVFSPASRKFDFIIKITEKGIESITVVSDNKIHAKRKNRYKLKKQHFYFNPESSFVLHQGDILVLLGRQLSIEHLQDLIETSRLKGRKLWTLN